MGRRRIECRVGRVGALWWRDNWPAARAAFKTCGGGVTIVISTGVRGRCGRWERSTPKAGRLGGPWKAETADMPRHKRWMARGIKRTILCCFDADGQRFFALPTKFAEQPSHRCRPSHATQRVSLPSESSLTSRMRPADASRRLGPVERRAHHRVACKLAHTRLSVQQLRREQHFASRYITLSQRRINHFD